ncbi:MAG: alanyl-tRNA editing protein, partial [Candidatus Hodarchaeota archaeon]
MTVLLHLEDNYLRKFEAKIVKTSPSLLVLDKTAFYPRGGGQESDHGTLEIDSERFRVVDCFKKGSEVFHKIEEENISTLKEGEIVRGEINWDRRYKMMRYHTAQHLISAIALDIWGAVTAGNQIHEEHSRIDFLMESGNPIDFEELFKLSNEEMAKNRPVNVFFLDRDEAENKL